MDTFIVIDEQGLARFEHADRIAGHPEATQLAQSFRHAFGIADEWEAFLFRLTPNSDGIGNNDGTSAWIQSCVRKQTEVDDIVGAFQSAYAMEAKVGIRWIAKGVA